MAKLAGIATDEGLMMQILTSHLKDMETKLLAMSQEQQDRASEAIEQQQAVMQAQMDHQREIYENKLAALQQVRLLSMLLCALVRYHPN